MAKLRLDRVLVVDLEETCWEGEPPSGQHREVVEIGVTEVHMDGGARLGRSASYLVRPLASEPSAFFTALTGIERRTLMRQGRSLAEVCGRIRKEFGGGGKAWAAWGRDDTELARDCAANGLDMPFSDGFIDLGHLWGMLSGSRKAVGLRAAMTSLGLEFEGTPHRAGDDAMNTARLLVEIAGTLRLRLPPPGSPGPAPAP